MFHHSKVTKRRKQKDGVSLKRAFKKHFNDIWVKHLFLKFVGSVFKRVEDLLRGSRVSPLNETLFLEQPVCVCTNHLWSLCLSLFYLHYLNTWGCRQRPCWGCTCWWWSACELVTQSPPGPGHCQRFPPGRVEYI